MLRRLASVFGNAARPHARVHDSSALARRMRQFRHYVETPHTYWIDVTSACNLRCVFCPHSKGLARPASSLSLETVRRIVDEVCENRPMLRFYVVGEPLLHKQLPQMIAYAAGRNCSTVIHTNATLLDRRIGKALIDSSLDSLYFSFDGTSKGTYQALRGADYDAVERNIREFLALQRALGVTKPATTIGVIETERTRPEIAAFIRRWRDSGVSDIEIKREFVWPGTGVAASRPRIGTKPCTNQFGSSTLLSDGTVVPCSVDAEGALALGNVHGQSMHEIYKGEPYRKLRLQHLRDEVPRDSICYSCGGRQIDSRGEWLRLRTIRSLGMLRAAERRISA